MIKITEEKLILFSVLTKGAECRDMKLFYSMSQNYSPDCNKSALELLETKDGRDLLRKEISAKDLRLEKLSRELISDQFESINPNAGE